VITPFALARLLLEIHLNCRRAGTQQICEFHFSPRREPTSNRRDGKCSDRGPVPVRNGDGDRTGTRDNADDPKGIPGAASALDQLHNSSLVESIRPKSWLVQLNDFICLALRKTRQ
jgi:hypothetical protein